ncbi:MAG: CDP-alcohol phosphatidyltransferase family protein [Gammaproteobacteria bacterium]
MKKHEIRYYTKPAWVLNLENHIGNTIPFHPNVISSIKLFVLTPLILLALYPDSLFNLDKRYIIVLFILFGLLDYLDGVVARAKNKASKFGLIYDRITDYPLLLGLSWLVFESLPPSLLITKLVLDAAIITLYFFKGSYSENRIRSSINFSTLLLLLLISLNINSRYLNTDLAVGFLFLSIFVNSIVLLRNLGILQKRFIADLLSAANMACGGYSIYMAYLGRLDLSLLFIILGAAFDGLDGAAARKFGSTRFGVYSDDIADGFTYGIAPGTILILHFNSLPLISSDLLIDSYILGIFYSLFTISRLIFFTLNKANSDPDYFLGIPSTLAGIIVVSATYLFDEHIALIGLMVGFSGILMVAFDSQYRHMGRFISTHGSVKWFSIIVTVLLMTFGIMGLQNIAIALILAGCILYGLYPVYQNFQQLIRKK